MVNATNITTAAKYKETNYTYKKEQISGLINLWFRSNHKLFQKKIFKI